MTFDGKREIYITGDTHGRFDRLEHSFLKAKGINKEDIIIVAGDFGFLWNKENTEDNIKYFNKYVKNKVLWIPGNHENYDMIAEYPLSDWHGGKVRHIIKNRVIMLERGQYYDIDGKTFFTFGGASSHDISAGILDPNDKDFKRKYELLYRCGGQFRVKGFSWWEQELPTDAEMETGLDTIDAHEYKVDYIITHCASTIIENQLGYDKHDKLTDYLNFFEHKVDFKKWYFGHYHQNRMVDNRHYLIYDDIIRVC